MLQDKQLGMPDLILHIDIPSHNSYSLPLIDREIAVSLLCICSIQDFWGYYEAGVTMIGFCSMTISFLGNKC